MVLGLLISVSIPLYAFHTERKFSVFDAGAIAAAYGSVSAVTFITAVTFSRITGNETARPHGGHHGLDGSAGDHRGLALISLFNKDEHDRIQKRSALRHSFTNGSVLLIIGSLLIGYFANAKQAEGIKPFTNDLFKGFLAIFLLDMGVTSGRKLKAFFSFGWFPVLFGLVIPLVNGCVVALPARW